MQIYGIDLSKSKFDVNFLDANGKSVNKTVKNDLKSISKFLSKVPKDTVLCAENTGTYGDLLVFLCNQYEIKIALVPGYNVKQSLGLVKGKTDPIDAAGFGSMERGSMISCRLRFIKVKVCRSSGNFILFVPNSSKQGNC